MAEVAGKAIGSKDTYLAEPDSVGKYGGLSSTTHPVQSAVPMTMLLGCISNEQVVQVSDRRLTWVGADGKVIGIRDDDKNKAVVASNWLAMSYTGLAELAGEQTHRWLMMAAGGASPFTLPRILEHVAERATKTFASLPVSPIQKRHAFLLSGWEPSGDSGSHRPFMAVISNALDEAPSVSHPNRINWSWLASAEPEFRVQIRPLPLDQPFLWACVGQRLGEPVAQQLDLHAAKCVRQSAGPSALIRVLAEAIRVSAANNTAIGRNLMAVSVPRKALTGGQSMLIPLTEVVRDDEVTAVYLPEREDRTIRYGPSYIQVW